MGYNFVLSLLDRPSVLKKNNRPLTGPRKVSNSFRSKEKKYIYIYLSTFLEMKKKESKPHQEEVKGDIFHWRTKVPFMRQFGENTRAPSVRRKCEFLPPSALFVF